MKINLQKKLSTLSISASLQTANQFSHLFRFGTIILVLPFFLLLGGCMGELIKTFPEQSQQMMNDSQDLNKLIQVLIKQYEGEVNVVVGFYNDVNYLEVTFNDKIWGEFTEEKRQTIAENIVDLVSQEYPKLAKSDYIYVIFMYNVQTSFGGIYSTYTNDYGNFTFQKIDNSFQLI